jgi:uncharacterized coiled-coil DUF342 family protein
MTPLVETLEQRIEALEIGAKFDVTKEQVRKVELDFLDKLKQIRAQLIAEQKQGGAGGGSAAERAELEALRAENALLKQKNQKLSYRVNHVVSNMNKMLEERKNE